MTRRKVTQNDLIKYPKLKERGVRVGQEIDFPDQDKGDKNEIQNNEGDTGGSNPPPPKGRG